MYLTNTDLVLMITISILIKCIRMKEFEESLFSSKAPIPFKEENSGDLIKFLKDFQLRIAIGLFIFALIGTIVVESLKIMRFAVSIIGRSIVIFVIASIASMLLIIIKPIKFLSERVVVSLLDFIISVLIHIIKKDRIHHQMWRKHIRQESTSNLVNNRANLDHTHLI